jgi:hypothetical protein
MLRPFRLAPLAYASQLSRRACAKSLSVEETRHFAAAVPPMWRIRQMGSTSLAPPYPADDDVTLGQQLPASGRGVSAAPAATLYQV